MTHWFVFCVDFRPERRSREISAPISFSHVAHMGPDQVYPTSIPIPTHGQQ